MSLLIHVLVDVVPELWCRLIETMFEKRGLVLGLLAFLLPLLLLGGIFLAI